jgi:2-polyprenyl-3-methyl-5-hydroxy-6-metoxy-1,4-benzoquinol methylase
MNLTSKVQDFQKYAQQGAYHWITLRPSFKTSFNPYLHARYSVALEQVDRYGKGGAAVDLGCGDAYISVQLGKRGYQVRGIDGSDKAVELGRSMAKGETDRVDLEVGNVCDTGLGESSTDLMISLDVIEHLDDAEGMLREMVRIGKNGAVVLIGTPIRYTETPLDKYHVKEFFSDEFEKLLGKYFTVLELRKTHPMEFAALMGRQFSVFGKKKNLGWNAINLFYMLTRKNPFSDKNCQFPTYQFAACRLAK